MHFNTSVKKSQDIAQLFPFLANDQSGFSEAFAAVARPVKLESGQHICQEGTRCSHLALVLSGTARVYKLGENGREITLYRIGPGESCVLTASCLLSQTPFPAFAVCETEVQAISIPAPDVNRWIAEFVPWRRYVFSLIAHRLGEIISVVEEVAFRRMDQRIASYLIRQCEGSLSSQVSATHQQVASDLGTSREVVTRILKDLETQGLISTTRKAIVVVDAQALREKAGDLRDTD